MTSSNSIISIQEGQKNLRAFAANPRARYNVFALKRHLVEAGLTALGLGTVRVDNTEDRLLHYQKPGENQYRDKSMNRLLAQIKNPSIELKPDLPEGEDERRRSVLETFQRFDDVCREPDVAKKFSNGQWEWKPGRIWEDGKPREAEDRSMIYFCLNAPGEHEEFGWYTVEEIEQSISKEGGITLGPKEIK